MGIQFSYEEANIVGWLTQFDPKDEKISLDYGDFPYGHEWFLQTHPLRYPPSLEARKLITPRARVEVLKSFLENLPRSILSSSARYLVLDLIEQSKIILQKIIAEPSIRAKAKHPKDLENILLPPDFVKTILAPIKSWFYVPFFVLFLDNALVDKFRPVFNKRHLFFLAIRDFNFEDGGGVDLLDPFPALSEALKYHELPAAVCWTIWGEHLVVKRDKIRFFYRMLSESHPERLWEELRQLDSYVHLRESESHDVSEQKPANQIVNVLHISDLHFGAGTSEEKITYIRDHLSQKLNDEARNLPLKQFVVISGDLIDTPSDDYLNRFQQFVENIRQQSPAEIIVIPGNHDVKRKGFLWTRREIFNNRQLWRRTLVYDDAQVIFICFDSNYGFFARGKINENDLIRMGHEIDQLISANPVRSKFTFIAVVHHHPFSVSEEEHDVIRGTDIHEEFFVRMKNGEKFIEWCARRGVTTVLHGHKHKPRFQGREIPVSNQNTPRLVRAIGCGTTFGVEDKPFSYNWLDIDLTNKIMTVRFVADIGDASGFTEHKFLRLERM